VASAFKIFQILLKQFGSQGWWPTAPANGKRPAYHSAPLTAGHTESQRFEICIGAILTQNTAWSNVEKALCHLHEKNMMSPQKIAKAPSGILEKMIRSSGYFRQKTKKIKIFSNFLIQKYHGKITPLLKQSTEKVRLELLNLFGLGPETVDSMLLYAGGHPIFVVDAYTRRIGNRIGLFDTEKYEEIQNYFHRTLDHSAVLYNEFHALLVALGKNICKTNPLCPQCPLIKVCHTGIEYGKS
jgi:endonuclease III related protein